MEVLDFYEIDKLKVNKVSHTLLFPASFEVLVKIKDKIKTLIFTIPSKYCYSNIKEHYVKDNKVKCFTLLKDYILSSKRDVKEKYKLTDIDYKDLLLGLELCVIKKYSKLSKIMMGIEIFKKVFIDRLFKGKAK